MDPVLQRFGDVTIQRLEKPKDTKVRPQSDSTSLEKFKDINDEVYSDPENDSADEEYPEESPPEFAIPNLKRPLQPPPSQGSLKKFKFNAKGDITLEKKCDDLGQNNFSEPEISDYEEESDIDESDSELMNEPSHMEVPGDIKPPAEKETSEDEVSSSASFFEKLVEQVDIPAPSTPSSSSSQKNTEPIAEDDYDIDIKEKLKEMGEISFETVKKGEKPKKTEPATENEVVVTPAKKFGADGEEITCIPKGIALRRNIREVMDETKLDESTLAAQRQEAERLRRVQEQQRLLRELQRQAAQERMQHKVMAMLQGNQFSKPGTSNQQTRIGNTVLVKLPNGQTKSMTRIPRRPFELLRVPKNASPSSAMGAPKGRGLIHKRPPGADLTPSVSIAPVGARKMGPMGPMMQQRHSDSDEDNEERKAMLMPPMVARRPKGKQPVQTIDISSDDDCIVVSEPEGDDDEPEDDPTNSGMHTNDDFNQPDEQGRVLVNVGHHEEEPDVFVAPQIARIIKPHQIGGVRFLYDNVVESINRFESSSGFGCILAHSMGLGKTLQIVTFSDIFLRHTPAKTILCIMPINTLQNWLAEFNMWLPTEENAPNSPLNSHGEVRPRNFNLHVLNDSHKTLVARAKVIHEWRSKGGVLLIGYEQFRLLSLRKFPKSRRKLNPAEAIADENKTKLLFDEVHSALVCPGPDLVICDEGHRIKNSHASISQALKQMETKRRVVLTGYPLQNNLMEYWCMVDFVRPNYLGSKTEFCNMFERPIMNGQCIDSTEADIKLMRYRAHVLHSLLLGFVQRRSHAVLQTALPQKEEYVLLVRMTSFQRTLYETFMNEVVRIQAVPNPLKAFAVCCKIWNHPDVLYNFLKKRARGEAVDIDLEEVGGAAVSKTAPPSPAPEKPKRAPAKPRKSPAKGKNGKPAASVTPYNSTSEPNQMQPPPPVSSAPPAPPVTSTNVNPPKTSPLTSFGNALSQTKDNTSFSQNTSSFQDISHSFPESIPQPYYDQEFDQNAQFPSSFPNHSNNYSYTDNPSSNTTFNNDSNYSMNNENVSTNQNQQNEILNLDSHQTTLTPLNNSSRSVSFANLPSGISLTPLSTKKENVSQGNKLTPITHSSDTLTPLPPSSEPSPMSTSSLTALTTTTSNVLASLNSENYMGMGNSPSGENSNYGEQNQFKQEYEDPEYNQNNYQDYQQNYWQQDQNMYNQDNHNNFFGPPNNQFDPNAANLTGNSANSSWIKKEDTKPVLTNLVSPKIETSNDSKPKINIISDIKLPSVFSSNSNMSTHSEKKINIISDIKIEPKMEEIEIKEEILEQLIPKGEQFPVKVEQFPVKVEQFPVKIEQFPVKVEQFPVKDELSSVKIEPKTEPVDVEPKIEAKSEEDIKPPPVIPVNDNPFAKMSSLSLRDSKEDSGIPYDWALELLRDYKPGFIENGAKMQILFCIIRESIALGDRLLVFSQSLITLDLIEQFLQSSQVPGDTVNWAKNVSYYRLDGSTSALEREKLINEFNSNPKIHLFLVSTRAGSLGINLIGANRVVVLDASWNPCHDTQAVCRVYRYGQRKPCFVYRLVVDNCLEKKIYDRQINKQGMSDRVVDECNPDAHLTLKDVSTLCWDDKRDDGPEKDWAPFRDNYIDVVLQKVLEKHGTSLSKEPFQHESLLVDRKEKQLSVQEKRLAKKGYEREKQAARQPMYNMLGSARGHRPVASVRPMQQGERPSRWIPAEHWQRQGMTAQEMTLPLDVVIPTNQPEKGNIVLKAGQKVLVLKSPKGVYMQLESGKIVAIKTAIKVKGKADEPGDSSSKMTKPPLLPPTIKANPSLSVVPQKRPPNKPFVPGGAKFNVQSVKQNVPNLVSRIRSIQKKIQDGKVGKKPISIGSEIAKSLIKDKDESSSHFMSGSDDEHNQNEKPESVDEIQKRISLLKKNISIQRVTSQPKHQQQPQSVSLQQLPPPPPPSHVDDKDDESSPEDSDMDHMEHNTSGEMNDDIPFQDTLDSITSAYQATNDDNLENFEDDISETSDAKQQEQSEVSDQSDDVTYISDQSPNGGSQYPAQNGSQTQQNADPSKPNESQEYGQYNNYYNYNMPPYPAHGPPPPQGYTYPPQHPPPYDMMSGYPPPAQQPQYNYGYQGYPPPPQPHYPPPPPPTPGYDYSNPPAQPPMYGGYHQPYPPQQYAPPPQGMYPPPPTPTPAPPYPEFPQYSQLNNAPAPAPYYPNT